MKINTSIHSKFHILKALIGNTVARLVTSPADQLIVLNYHGTQKKYITNFEAQIRFLQKHYRIISPAEFREIVYKGDPVKGKKLLLTFDDGIKNNSLAIEVLERLDLFAYFFVVPGFIDSENQKEYFIKNIRPVINSEIDNEAEDFSALSWNELSEISKRHTIGCHTYSHTMIKDTLNEERLEKELLVSKKEIEQKLNCSIDSFCSINNTLQSVGRRERRLIESNYKYHFTTFGGNNSSTERFLIKRINVESHWLPGAFKFALSPFEMNRWNDSIVQFLNNTQ